MKGGELTFGDQVISVLEIQARRWKYWDLIWQMAEPLPDKEVKRRLGWDKRRIQDEWCLAWTDLLLG